MSWYDRVKLNRQQAEQIREEIKSRYHREAFGQWDPNRLVFHPRTDPNLRQRAQLDGPFYTDVEVSELTRLDDEERFLVYGLFIGSNGDVDLYYWNPSQRALCNSRGARLE